MLIKPTTEYMLAELTIRRAPDMTREQRRDVADWLRAQAQDLIDEGAQYADRFRARYWSK